MILPEALVFAKPASRAGKGRAVRMGLTKKLLGDDLFGFKKEPA
jgi:hypothetical protein